MKALLTLTISAFAQLTTFAEEPAPAITPISAEKAAVTIKADPKIIIVDVRTPKEFKAGHIANAININFKSKDFAKELAKLDTSKTYLMHCRSGARSTKSIQHWEKLGFKKVLHLDTGYLGWLKANQPVTTGVKNE